MMLRILRSAENRRNNEQGTCGRMRGRTSPRGLRAAVPAYLLAVLLLTGCAGGQVPQDDAVKKARQGQEMMQAFLDEHLPGAEVLSAETCEGALPGGLLCPADYVQGEFSDGEQTFRYMIHTKNGKVYTSQYAARFEEEARTFLRETPQTEDGESTGLPGADGSFPAPEESPLPGEDPGPGRARDSFRDTLAPFGTEDMGSFIRAVNRPLWR